MRCRLVLAVAGLLVSVGFAQAQHFAPTPLQPVPIGSVEAALLPAVIAPITQASHRSTSTANCGPVVAYGDGCAAPSGHKAHDRKHAGIFGKMLIGPDTINPVSCGCPASERTFAFGSCKQFFNPQLECNGGRGGCGGHGGNGGCSGCWAVDRRPPGLGVTSYLNR